MDTSIELIDSSDDESSVGVRLKAENAQDSVNILKEDLQNVNETHAPLDQNTPMIREECPIEINHFDVPDSNDIPVTRNDGSVDIRSPSSSNANDESGEASGKTVLLPKRSSLKDAKRFQCRVCGYGARPGCFRVFKKKNDKNVHEKLCTYRRHECHLCEGFITSFKSNLQTHMRKHTG